MKIIFFGTSEFAAVILKKLTEGGNSIAAVVTQPDKKSGRKLKVSPSPVKGEAGKLSLPVYQPEDIAENAFIDKLKDEGADFFVVVAYGTIMPKALLDMPRFCPLGIHPSLLPKYRGASPINRALINGDDKTGVTIIKMNEKMDAGDIALQKEIGIGPSDTAEVLGPRLAAIGAELVMEAMESIKAGRADFRKQDEKQITFAPKLKKEDGKIDWNMTTPEILNRIRGLKPWPGTYSSINGRTIKIISAGEKKGEFSSFSPGQVITADQKEGLVVKTGDSALSISEVQLEGKKAMGAKPFLRGCNIKPGTILK